jgi:hypothetical protein
MHWDEILTRFKIKSSEKARWTRDFADEEDSFAGSCKILHILWELKFYAQTKIREALYSITHDCSYERDEFFRNGAEPALTSLS